MEKTQKIQQYKVDAINALKDRFGEVKDFIFTDYRGLSVDQITELRNKLREQNAEYRVVKNQFAKLAFHDMDFEGVDDFLVGPTALALSRDESGPVAKTIIEFGKETSIEVKGGIIDGIIFDEKQVEEFSKLPTKDELIAKLMSAMNGPAQNMAMVLNGVVTKLARTLQAVADQKEQQ
ncbi:MAG: 50S ribosomal protein L10 [Spirochaetales bacterium]|nr:50S ribosomal protein L10 [Spirochaetales bacterium]MCF7937776.1 50S ribosomal protein L10 [Spirochaetales bacterium]